MSKPYVRKRGKMSEGNIHTFACKKCPFKTERKEKFKIHYALHK